MRLSTPRWLTFRRFAGFTTGLTVSLIALGVYTAATGSGLACSQQWPLCDGGVLPQSLPSFIEWLHRLVAMIAGWFIVGTALWAWRGKESLGARAFATVAVVLLPLQITIGAVTVTLSGLIPWGYTMPTHAAHLGVALIIFGALTLTTLYAGGRRRSWRRIATLGLVVALATLMVGAVFSRLTVVPVYSPLAQAAFYGISLIAIGGLLAATVGLGREAYRRAQLLAGGGLLFAIGHLLLGRDLVLYTAETRLVNLVVLLLAIGLTAAATWLSYRPKSPKGSTGSATT